MLKQFVSLFLAASLSLSAGATDVSGVIRSNTTWTKANSPYILKGNLAVDAGVTLTIEPGAAIKADGWYALFIDGRLVANGTPSDNILFTSNIDTKKGAWTGIHFRDAAKDSSSFQYCTVQYATRGIKIEASYVNIDRCNIIYNGNGIENWYTHEGILVTNNNISWNDNGIFQLPFNGGLIDGNTIANNNVGVHIGGNTSCVLSYNQIVSNTEGIVTTGGWGGAKFSVLHNIIVANKNNGILLKDGFNSFDSIAFNAIGFNGTGIVTGCHTGNICYNTITNNKTGVEYSFWTNNGKLGLINNCIYSNVDYDFINNCVDNFLIANNYWGSTDTSAIDSKILDYYDDPAKYGKILFFPFATSADTSCKTITQPTSITETSKAMTGVKAYPNPATDIVHLKFTNAATDLSVGVTDLTGKIIFTSPVTNQKLDINMQQWPAGLYLVKYQGDGTSGVIKLIKE